MIVLLRFPVQRLQPLGDHYFYLQGTPVGFAENVKAWEDDISKQLQFEEEIRKIGQTYVAEGKRFGGLTQAVSTVRLLSRSREELLGLRDDIENNIRSKFSPELQSAFDGVQ